MASLGKSVKNEYYKKTHLCHCCLSSDRLLRPLIEYQQYKNILLRLIGDNTYKKSRNEWKYFLCWECIAVLRKIYLFQRKVLNAQKLLNLNEAINFSSLSNLSKNTLEPTSYDYTAEMCIEGTKLEIEFDKEELFDTKEELWDFKEEHIAEDEDPIDNTEYNIDTTQVEKSNSKLKTRKVLKSELKYEVVVSELDVKYSKLSTTIENNKIIMKQIRNSNWFKNTKHNCKKCVEIFHGNIMKRLHFRKFHSKNASHACDSCDSRFCTKERLDEHFKTHFYMYKCTVCPTVTATESQNKEHHRLNHRKAYCCKKCSMAFGQIREFRKHHKEVHEKYVCDKCGKTYISKKLLQRHIQHYHMEQRCQPCGKTFGTYKTLQRHNYMYHTGTDNSYCVECDKRFSTTNLFRRHLHGTAHRPKYKAFPCPDCDKRYSSKTAMKNHHSFVHLGTSDYYCAPCDRTFVSSSKRWEHVRKIHERRPLPKNKLCTICGKGFTHNRILTNHVRTHTGERPHECEHCPAKFAQLTAMKNHVKAIHMK